METKQRIILESLHLFNDKGIKFTVDDLANSLGMSKRTIYEIFPSKANIIEAAIKETWENIKQQENNIINNNSLDIIDKIKKVVCIMPNSHNSINFKKLPELKKVYPKLYNKIEINLSANWEITLGLFKTAMDKGKIKKVNLMLIRQIILGTMKELLDENYVKQEEYENSLNQLMNILLEGLLN